MIRNLQAWHSWYESTDVPETIVASDGRSYCLWDIDLFYSGRVMLADQQRMAIEVCLYQNVLEREAAVRMGVQESNPVSIYATIGLTYMLDAAIAGTLPGGYRIVVEQMRESA